MLQLKLFKAVLPLAPNKIRFNSFSWRLFLNLQRRDCLDFDSKIIEDTTQSDQRFASEHGARMTAMHKATDNATI
jgi:hypothetical protein